MPLHRPPGLFAPGQRPHSLLRPLNLYFGPTGSVAPAPAAYNYTGSVDSALGWAFPTNAAELDSLLLNLGVGTPDALWLYQDASGNVIDSLNGGAHTLGISGTPTYQASVSGVTRKGITVRDGSADTIAGTLGDNMSCTVLSIQTFYPSSLASTRASLVTLGNNFGKQVAANLNIGGASLMKLDDHGGAGFGGTTVVGTFPFDNAVHPLLVQANLATSTGTLMTDKEVLQHGMDPLDSPRYIAFGGDNNNFWLAGGQTVLYGCAWTGSKGELTENQCISVLDRFQNPTQAGPAWKRASSFVVDVGSGKTVPWPTHAAGDYALLVNMQIGNPPAAEVLTDAQGFTLIGVSDATGADFHTKLTVWGKLATTANEGTPVIASSGLGGDSSIAQMYTFFRATGVDVTSSAGSTSLGAGGDVLDLPGALTTGANRLVVSIGGHFTDAGSDSISGFASAQPGFRFRQFQMSGMPGIGGQAGSLVIGTGVQAAAGTYAHVTGTYPNGGGFDSWAGMTVALK